MCQMRMLQLLDIQGAVFKATQCWPNSASSETNGGFTIDFMGRTAGPTQSTLESPTHSSYEPSQKSSPPPAFNLTKQSRTLGRTYAQFLP